MNGLKAAAVKAQLDRVFPWQQDYEVSWELGKTWAHTVTVQDTRTNYFVTILQGTDSEIAANIKTVKGWRKQDAK